MESAAPYSLADDLNNAGSISKYSHGSADPTTHTTWAERQTVFIVLLASTIVYSIQAALSATNEETGKTFYGWGWQSSDNVAVRIGALFKMVCDDKTCLVTALPTDSYGHASKKSAVIIWYAMHLLQIIGSWLACAFLFFAPHPSTDDILRYYRYGLRTAAVILPASLAIAYALLSTLATTQASNTIGVAGLVIEATSLVGVSFALFWASRLVRDVFWLENRARAKMDRESKREYTKHKRAEERQKRQASQSLKRALGKEGVRALTMNRLMGAMSADKSRPAVQSYAMQPQPQPQPANYGFTPQTGYSNAMPMQGYYAPTPAQPTPYYDGMQTGLATGFGYGTPQTQQQGMY